MRLPNQEQHYIAEAMLLGSSKDAKSSTAAALGTTAWYMSEVHCHLPHSSAFYKHQSRELNGRVI